jgi:hypothetical protein
MQYVRRKAEVIATVSAGIAFDAVCFSPAGNNVLIGFSDGCNPAEGCEGSGGQNTGSRAGHRRQAVTEPEQDALPSQHAGAAGQEAQRA